jgi:small subunit ribosomal protein S9
LAEEEQRAWKTDPIQTVGRRKSAVARVVLRPGSGEWEINGRSLDDYFPILRYRETAGQPFRVTDTEGMFDVLVRANGGGLTGQADAVQLGVARALVEWDGELKEALRAEGLLTRDPRVVERKKPGQPKARKKFQFSKR